MMGEQGGDGPVPAPLDPDAAVFRPKAGAGDLMDVSEELHGPRGGESAPAVSPPHPSTSSGQPAGRLSAEPTRQGPGGSRGGRVAYPLYS
jgi:hypothetical protein